MKDYTQVMQNEDTRWCVVDTGGGTETTVVSSGHSSRARARFERDKIMKRMHVNKNGKPLKRGRFRVAKVLVTERIFIPTK